MRLGRCDAGEDSHVAREAVRLGLATVFDVGVLVGIHAGRVPRRRTNRSGGNNDSGLGRTTASPHAQEGRRIENKPDVLLEVLTFVTMWPTTDVLTAALESFIGTLPKEDRQAVATLYKRRLEKLAGGNDRLADFIREMVLRDYILPARERGEAEITLYVSDVHRRAGLVQRYPAVISALRGKPFARMAGVRFLNHIGASESSATRLRFEILPTNDQPNMDEK